MKNSKITFEEKWFEFRKDSWKEVLPTLHLKSVHLSGQFEAEIDVSDAYLARVDSELNAAALHEDIFSFFGEFNSLMKTSGSKTLTDYVESVKEVANVKSPLPNFHKWMVGVVVVSALILI